MGTELEEFLVVASIKPIVGNFKHVRKYSTKEHFINYRSESSTFSVMKGDPLGHPKLLFLGDLKNFYITRE